jgi:simple sugar transport system permease protein
MIKNDTDLQQSQEQDVKRKTGRGESPPKNTFFQSVTRDTNLTRLFVIMVLIFIALSLARPKIFPTLQNFQSMSTQFPEIGILAIAIMITMLTGGIDLSVVSTGNLAAILASMVLTRIIPGAEASAGQVTLGISLAILVALVTGLVAGLFNGLLVAKVGITPILATLGTLTMYTGFNTVITRGTSFFAVPQFLTIGSTLGGIPVPLIIFIILAAIFSIILNKTTFGYKIYMMGTNPTAARFSGIDNEKVLIKTYVLSGMLASIAGIIFLARNNSAKADYGDSYVLLVVLIAILGGINHMGGFGKISGLVLAILSLQFLSTGLNMLLFRYSGSNFFKEFAWGALLLIVMVINQISNQRRARTPQKKSGTTGLPQPQAGSSETGS